MDYYDINCRNVDNFGRMFMYLVPLQFDNVRKVRAGFYSYEYVAASADAIGEEYKDFEDQCRRDLYGMTTIKMGFKEHKELDMIRTEKKVQMLRVLLEMALLNSNDSIRADQHIIEKIDLDKFVEMYEVDMAESLQPHKLQILMAGLRTTLEQEIRIQEKAVCECYMVENREIFFNPYAIQEKFYFFHNALQRRIVILKYCHERQEQDDPGTESDTGNETEDEAGE